MSDRSETVVLRGLLHREEFARKVLPFLKPEYFTLTHECVVYKQIHEHYRKYNVPPSMEVLRAELANASMDAVQYTSVTDVINDISTTTTTDTQWLYDFTEKFCQAKALYLAAMKTVKIMDGDKKTPTTAIPNLFTEALGVSFNPVLGHDYIDDFHDRYNLYHLVENKIPFGMKFFNKITRGGCSKKTLTCIAAATGVGKSAFMCDWAANAFLANHNVLYVTLEMADMRIGERVDANIMDLTMDDLHVLTEANYTARIKKIQETVTAKFKMIEYAPGTATAATIGQAIDDLRLKQKFVPDIIFVDYLNLCASSRVKPSANVGMYQVFKAVTEELRGLAVRYEVPVVTATQLNRSAYNNSQISIANISESLGIAHTADLVFALVETPELVEMNQMLVLQLKNRYSSLKPAGFAIGVDKPKMKFYDVNVQPHIEGITDDLPAVTAEAPKTNIIRLSDGTSMNEITGEEICELPLGRADITTGLNFE